MQPKMTQKGFNDVGSSRNNIIRCFPNGMVQFKSNTLQVGCLNGFAIGKRMIASTLPH